MTKVIDIINKKTAPFVSFELVPPLKGSDINKLYHAIEPLIDFLEALVDCFKTFVHAVKPFIHFIKALADRLYLFADNIS